MTSEFFYPHIGGIETVTEYLADEFTRMGHEVKIITNAIEKGDKNFSYQILRKPSVKTFWKAYKWCDVFVHQGISLKRVWPLLIKKKPWFVVYHQTSYGCGIKGFVKRILSNFSNNIAVSKVVYNGHHLKDGVIIYNSYNNKIFQNYQLKNRKGIVYVGKLFRSKGCFLLIDAFIEYKKRTKSNVKLTIVGDGTDGEELKKYAKSTIYSSDICFLGFKNANEVCDILNRNEVQIVPSIDIEAFGLVVLEGLATGCFVIGSDGNGIEEALDGGGLIFKRGDMYDLVDKLMTYYQLSKADINTYKEKANKRLAELSLNYVAKKYIHEFDKGITKR